MAQPYQVDGKWWIIPDGSYQPISYTPPSESRAPAAKKPAPKPAEPPNPGNWSPEWAKKAAEKRAKIAEQKPAPPVYMHPERAKRVEEKTTLADLNRERNQALLGVDPAEVGYPGDLQGLEVPLGPIEHLGGLNPGAYGYPGDLPRGYSDYNHLMGLGPTAYGYPGDLGLPRPQINLTAIQRANQENKGTTMATAQPSTLGTLAGGGATFVNPRPTLAGVVQPAPPQGPFQFVNYDGPGANGGAVVGPDGKRRHIYGDAPPADIFPDPRPMSNTVPVTPGAPAVPQYDPTGKHVYQTTQHQTGNNQGSLADAYNMAASNRGNLYAGQTGNQYQDYLAAWRQYMGGQ